MAHSNSRHTVIPIDTDTSTRKVNSMKVMPYSWCRSRHQAVVMWAANALMTGRMGEVPSRLVVWWEFNRFSTNVGVLIPAVLWRLVR